MSHSKERVHKNCLNCNAEVQGRYCHICGQENIEPAESMWQLITHFFNDITHFDGKFFSTLKLVLLKPGFLSAEYMAGRRFAYLNPVRMYIFTSFAFFVIFFSMIKLDESNFKQTINGKSIAEINKLDSAAFNAFTKKVNEGKPMTRRQFDQYLDSNENNMGFSFDSKYKSIAQYDSLVKAGVVKDSWLMTKLNRKGIELNEKVRENSQTVLTNLFNILIHNFPQMLFISLPLFAWFLKMLYFRHPQYYFVSHGIYAVHLYIFYFIILLAIILFDNIGGMLYWSWMEASSVILIPLLFYYEYKAMRNFYGQRRAITLFKFLLAVCWRLFIVILLFTIFLVFSVFKV